MDLSVSVDTPLIAGDNIPEHFTPDSCSLITFLSGSLAVLWKDWPKHMQCTLLNKDKKQFSLSGTCPHCRRDAVFMIVAGPHSEYLGEHRTRHCAAMRCQGCLKFILGIAESIHEFYEYEEHYPLGTPDDSVSPAVPISIASDFSEALRCFFIRSYRACVAMCRRSVEASCHDLGAQGKNLKERIDYLANTGRITEPLKEMAHKVRLTANEELHGKPDDLDTFTESEAEGIVEFVREYFHHVYVMPEKLANYGKPHTPPTP
jgi:hypothetical protein